MLSISFMFLSAFSANAEDGLVEYVNDVIVDYDLDGLTDEGEKQIFNTDPQKIDTDNDGFKDGSEILTGYDPLDSNSFPGTVQVDQNESNGEIPWAWYVSRAAGLIGFVLLYISIFLGLTLRIPLMRKIFKPLYAANIHCWISLQATLFAFLHGVVLLFDKFLKFSLVDLFVPFVSSYEPIFLSMGIISFYLMIILVVSSYMRSRISYKSWRILHFTNIALYIFSVVHAAKLGTDLKDTTNFNIFLFLNAFLVFLMLLNMQLRITERIKLRKKATLAKQASVDSEVLG